MSSHIMTKAEAEEIRQTLEDYDLAPHTWQSVSLREFGKLIRVLDSIGLIAAVDHIQGRGWDQRIAFVVQKKDFSR